MEPFIISSLIGPEASAAGEATADQPKLVFIMTPAPGKRQISDPDYVLVPEYDNQGNRFPLRLRGDLQRRLIAEFGGYTRQSGVIGEWRHEGRVYRDRSFQYVVSLSSWAELPRWLEIVKWVCQTFQQVAIYVEVAGVPDFIGPD